MSDLIIKIGDNDIDLNIDETIAITKQAAKVGDFSTVLADGTNEVTVPLTPRNRIALDNAHLIQSDSNKPYGRLDAMMIQEGYQTIQDGYAIVKSSSNNFSLQLIGGNASFFDLIKDLELRDLPLTDYEHFWTNQNVFDLRNETEGLIYAVFEQSGGDTQTMNTYSSTPNDRYAVETKLLLPSFYRKTIIEKIFSEQGYTFVTDLVTEDIYDKAIDFNAEIPRRGNDMSYHECTVRSTQDLLCNINGGTPFFGSQFDFPADSVEVDPNTSLYASSDELLERLQYTNGSRFNLTDSCTVTLDFELEIQSANLTTDVWVTIRHTSPDGLIETDTASQDLTAGTNVYSFSITVDVSLYDGECYFVPVIDTAPILNNITIKADSTYTVSNVELIAHAPITSEFPFNYFTGETMMLDMKQGEYLKECARMYQWMFDVDERTQTVTAKRFDQIKDSIPEAIDLSDKLHDNDIQINYGINGFAQTNALRYKEDDITKYDAVGYIDVADITLKAEKDYVKMEQFAASSTRLRFATVRAPYVPIFEEDLPTNGLTNRTLLVRRVNPFAENVNFARVGSTPANHPTDDLTFAYFAEAGNSDSLDFPTLINRFYQTVIDMNDKGKTVDCKMNLNIKDVMNYDPLKPVYIEKFNNYFYWEKLSNYVKDKLTKCTFVKI